MSSKPASKTVRIGNVWLNAVKDQEGNPVVENGKAKKAPTIKLGNKGNQDKKYDTSVEVIVRDGNGNVLSRQVDGYVQMYKPRTTEKTPANIKENLAYDLVVKLS